MTHLHKGIPVKEHIEHHVAYVSHYVDVQKVKA